MAVVDDEKLMIRPPSAIRLAACWQAKNVPFTLTAKIWSNSSSVTSATGLLNMMPALLTRMSSLCRFRSERVPLFRASGDHLSGCGAIRLTMLRDRANSPAWLAPARWLRGVAIGGPRPKRCPVEHPRDVTVELLAQRDGSLEEAQPGRRGVQIQLITT